MPGPLWHSPVKPGLWQNLKRGLKGPSLRWWSKMLPPGFGWEYSTHLNYPRQKGTLSFSVTPNMEGHEAVMETPNVNHTPQQPDNKRLLPCYLFEINEKLHLKRKKKLSTVVSCVKLKRTQKALVFVKQDKTKNGWSRVNPTTRTLTTWDRHQPPKGNNG